MLKMPYFLMMFPVIPKYQMICTLMKKKISGYLNILIASFLGVDHDSYSFLVKRMVWDKSTLSRLPKNR